MVEATRQFDPQCSGVFKSRLWEDVQNRISRSLGVSIKVASEDGSVKIPESNYSPVCELLKTSEKAATSCASFHTKNLNEGAFIKCGTCGFSHFCISTECMGKKMFILVGLCHDPSWSRTALKKASRDYGIDYGTLKSACDRSTFFPPDRIKELADLVLSVFNITVELSLQEYMTDKVTREKQEELAKMAALMDISLVINSTRYLKQLLKIVMQSAERVMQAEASSVFLIDRQTGELYFEVATGPKEEEVKKIRLKKGEGIAGWVASTGMSLLVPDVSRDPRFARRVDAETHFVTRSILCVPLKTKHEILGVVQVVNRLGADSFSDSETKFLEALAAQAAIAIENANLYENLEDRAAQLNTELTKANISLAIEKKRIESIVQSMEDAVIAVDRENSIVMANRFAEKVFSIKSEQAFNRTIGESISNRQIVDLFSKVFATKSSLREEVAFKIGGNEHAFAAVFAPIIGESGETAGTVAVFRDITESKEIDRMKTDFLNMVSHELRTPLTPIQAYSELMMMRNLDEEKIRSYASIINKETLRLGALIGDLLDLSRIDAGKGLSLSPEEVDIKELLNTVYNTFKSASLKHNIFLKTPDKADRLTIDRNKIIQVLSNLLSNAVKYSPDGGDIHISMEDRDNRFYISVSDEGLGMPKEALPKIFEKFYRVDSPDIKKISGTGIGLSIVKYIVELHEGAITVESEEGKGSKFTFFLPKTKEL
ncbi:MAG TPA: ATP-binding protein [Syntrophales bacterium]|nr:ATP-binding protein [Syntrophales bacterium]